MPETIEKAVSVVPWGIQADHPRNCDLIVQCVPGLRMRSAIDGSKSVTDAKTGEQRVPLDQARHLAAFPRVPGMELHVNPENCTYMVIDPLHGDEAMCKRIRQYLQDTGTVAVADKIDGAPPQKGTLDTHRMKTLCREMLNLVESNEAKRVKGPLPTRQDIDELPGKYLLNPGAVTSWMQPLYEEDLSDWVTNLARVGG